MAEEACVLMLKGMSFDSKRGGKWCGLCMKRNHNEEDCYYNPRMGVRVDQGMVSAFNVVNEGTMRETARERIIKRRKLKLST